MNLRLALCFVLNLTLAANGAQPKSVRGITPTTDTSLTVGSPDDENEAQSKAGAEVKKDLLNLFKLCQSERYAEAARHIVYRGSDKKRKWVDVYNYKNPAEREEVKGVCANVKEMLKQNDSYEFAKFFEETESEGKWHVWEIVFKKGEKTGKVSFALLKIKGRYALGDIDGHLAYLRAISEAKRSRSNSTSDSQKFGGLDVVAGHFGKGKDCMGGEFHEDLSTLIGEELRIIGATHIKDTRSGSGMDKMKVCFFSASGKIIAIRYSPRDGATCFIRDAGSAELSQYETWDTLWHLLGMDKNTETDEGLMEYLEMFPEGYNAFIEFIGTCLVKYFGSIR